MSSDQLKPREEVTVTAEDGYAFIVNWSKEGEEGTHFVLLMHFPGKHGKILFYLDPLALYRDPDGVFGAFVRQERALGRADSVYILKSALQGAGSWSCGFYCLYFIYLACMPESKLSALDLKPLEPPVGTVNGDCNLLHNLSQVLAASLKH